MIGPGETLRVRIVSAVVLLSLLTGCDSATTNASASVARDEAFAPYAPAPWRLLTWAERDRIVLFVSHIVISYRGAKPDAMFRPLDWAPDDVPTRTAEDARALALRVQTEAAAHPETFGALARRYSDDVVTRTRGGSLGGVRATQLPEEMLDALTVLRPGEVSRVVKGTWGFHILLRRAPPLGESVAARRIVIPYVHTMGGVDGTPTRSREEAFRLAEELVLRARAEPRSFPDLVARYSEHPDRAYGGDMGVYSTLDPDPAPREVETLSSTKIGEVADPIDSIWGFEVAQRVEVAPHPRYAMAAIRLRVRPDAEAGSPLSLEAASSRAQALLRNLRRAPSSFTEVQKENQSEGVESWAAGHGPTELMLALDELGFGEIATEPVRLPYQLVIPMRLDPALVPHLEPMLAYELPLRISPDFESLFRSVGGPDLARHLGGFTRPELASALRLTESERAIVGTTFERLSKSLPDATTPDQRVALYEDACRRLRAGMSEAGYSRFMAFAAVEAARLVLANP